MRWWLGVTFKIAKKNNQNCSVVNKITYDVTPENILITSTPTWGYTFNFIYTVGNMLESQKTQDFPLHMFRLHLYLLDFKCKNNISKQRRNIREFPPHPQKMNPNNFISRDIFSSSTNRLPHIQWYFLTSTCWIGAKFWCSLNSSSEATNSSKIPLGKALYLLVG